ncbi:MAG: hypothetical protein V4702_03940 [Patescibacteria group bacterium]
MIPVGDGILKSSISEIYPGDQNRGFLDIHAEALEDPLASKVIKILYETGLLTPGMSDAIGVLGLVRQTEEEITRNEPDNPLGLDSVDKLRGLLPEYDERWGYAFGVALSVTENERYELSHLNQTADEVLELLLASPHSELSDSEIMAVVSALAGYTHDAIPLKSAAKLIPKSSLEKVKSMRKLILQTDIEGFLINTAHNMAIVEDQLAASGLRLRAALNIIETLNPVLRMFGDGFEPFRIRARDGAGNFLAQNDPEMHDRIQKVRDLAARASEPALNIFQQMANGYGQVVAGRPKSEVSFMMKSTRKNIEIEDVADPLGYRVEAQTHAQMIQLVKSILDLFKTSKHAKVETPKYTLSIGRTDGEPAIELDIANSKEFWEKLGQPENVQALSPTARGYQIVHINFIMKLKDGSDPLNIELQIGTAKMHKRNEQGESIVAIYKLGYDEDDDISPIISMRDHIQRRASGYIEGKRQLSMSTQLKLIELMPEWETSLSKLYSVLSYQNKVIAYSKKLRNCIDLATFSDELMATEASVLVAPIGYMDKDTFIGIVGSIEPTFVGDRSKLRQTLTLLEDWHKDDNLRRDGNRHFEGHILPVALSYFINRTAQGIKIDVDELVAIIAHDGIEDEEDLSKREAKRKIVKQRLGKTVYTLVDLLTKDPSLAGDDADAEQAKRLAHADPKLRDLVLYMKVVDRFCSHTTDMEAAVAAPEEEAWQPRYSEYFNNSAKHFAEMFLENDQTRPLWLLCWDIFKAVEKKYNKGT